MLNVEVHGYSRVEILRKHPRLCTFLLFEQSPCPIGASKASHGRLQLTPVAQGSFGVKAPFQFHASTFKGLLLAGTIVEWFPEELKLVHSGFLMLRRDQNEHV